MKGRVYFRLEKGNPARLCDTLSRNAISSYEIDVQKRTFSVDAQNEKNAVALMDELCYNYTVIKRTGLKASVKKLTFRKGLFCALIFVISAVVALSNLLFSVRVSGLESIREKDVLQMLSGISVKEGMWTFSLDVKQVERVITAMEGVASVSVELRGNVLLINVKEELPPPDIVDLTEPVPLLSQYDAVLTRIVARQGTPLKEAGETVKKGDVLIAPYTLVGNEGEEQQLPLRAVGEAYGKTWLHERVVLPFLHVVRQRTGKSVSYRDIVFPPLTQKRDRLSPFENYEVVIERQTLGVLFPVEVVTQTFYEISESTMQAGERELEIAVAAAEFKIKSELPQDAVYLNKWYINDKTENSYIVDVYYEIEIRLDGGK